MLYNRIKAVREAQGMTRKTLAAAIACTTTTLWRYEHGVTHPTDSRLAQIAAALGVTPKTLVRNRPSPCIRRPRVPDVDIPSWVFPLVLTLWNVCALI